MKKVQLGLLALVVSVAPLQALGGDGHNFVTLQAFDLLRELGCAGSLQDSASDVALAAVKVDELLDLEFVDVEGGLGEGGRDDPHENELGAADDRARYAEWGFIFTAFDHFIDIGKGPGEFDDYDGYSYERGSGSANEYQSAAQLAQDELSGLTGQLVAALGGSGIKVDEGINWWLNDEYIHAPGQAWYRRCSPAVERYSFYGDKGTYGSVEEEAAARFPASLSTGSEGRGIPYSIFMPVDNMARYAFSHYLSGQDVGDLGMVLHAIQDACVPHHAAGVMGNWHSRYESDVTKALQNLFRDPQFRQEIRDLFREMDRDDPQPPASLVRSDYVKTPGRNWRIDMSVTWLALNAYHEYADVYGEFKNGYAFNDASVRELLKKATALTMIAINELSKTTPRGADASS